VAKSVTVDRPFDALRDALRDCVHQTDAAIEAGRFRLDRGQDSRDWARARDAARDADAAVRADAAADDTGRAAAEHVDLLLHAAMLVGSALGRYEDALLAARQGENDPGRALRRLRSALGELYLFGLLRRNAELVAD
jgi:hypothetical protein